MLKIIVLRRARDGLKSLTTRSPFSITSASQKRAEAALEAQTIQYAGFPAWGRFN
ncbi:MAG: hypothetical protein ACRD6X_15390 [Pyrinomonadaceae bacterium]